MEQDHKNRNTLACMGLSSQLETDCLGVVLACYFSDHWARPENDEDDDDHPGWGRIVAKNASVETGWLLSVFECLWNLSLRRLKQSKRN